MLGDHGLAARVFVFGGLAIASLAAIACAAGADTNATGGSGGSGGGAGGAGGSGGGTPGGCGPENPGACACMPGASEDCYSGPMGTQDIGLCKGGKRACGSEAGNFGVWGACTGEVVPQLEVCDAMDIDENCDGTSNEVCPCVPSMELCDGVDNNCDGGVDEGLTKPCGAGMCDDVQVCKAGEFTVCGAGQVVFEDSFEGAPAPVLSIKPPTVVSSWTVEAGDIDTMNDGSGFNGPSHTGAIAIDINGYEAGTISTKVSTDASATYVLTFVYTKNPGKMSPGAATADVLIDGVAAKSLSANPNNTYDDLKWQCGAVAFVAKGASTTITLKSTTDGNAGIYFDSFVLSKL